MCSAAQEKTFGPKKTQFGHRTAPGQPFFGFRLGCDRFNQALKLSEGRLLPTLIRIGRVWVEIKGLGERIQDL